MRQGHPAFVSRERLCVTRRVSVSARDLGPTYTVLETIGFWIPKPLETQVHDVLLFIVFHVLVPFLLTQLEVEIAGLESRGWGRTEQVTGTVAGLTVHTRNPSLWAASSRL